MTSAGANPFSNHPRLRLVFPDRGPSIDEARLRRDIARENGEAARMQAELADADVRRILALRIEESLEGGRAALLPAPRRRALVNAGHRLGLRPFESNLIIAIVQDAARRGKSSADRDTRAALGVIPSPDKPAQGRGDFWMWIRIALATAALATLMFTFLVGWLTRG